MLTIRIDEHLPEFNHTKEHPDGREQQSIESSISGCLSYLYQKHPNVRRAKPKGERANVYWYGRKKTGG